jgi:hypothetical protein
MRANCGFQEQMQLVENAGTLLAWADVLIQQQAQWTSERQAFLAHHLALRSFWEEAASGQRQQLEPLCKELRWKHQARQAQLSCSLAEAQRRLRQKSQVLAQDHEHMEQALLKRQRLARCRLRREEDRLAAREERLARDARERKRLEAACLEAEQARTEERHARLDMEKRRLEVELERDRALWHRITFSTTTQTIPDEMLAAATTRSPAELEGSVESENYSDDDFDDESFESLSESEGSSPRRSDDSSESSHRAESRPSNMLSNGSSANSEGSQVSSYGESEIESGSGYSSRVQNSRAPQETVLDSLASIASSVDLAESLESLQSIRSTS